MSYELSIVPTQLNPELTPELERDVAFFMKWGYLVVDDALSPEQIDLLGTTLDETFERTETQFIHQLLEEDERFDFLLDNPPIIRRMEAILGTCLQLHSATARVTTPGEEDQDWHRDTPWPADPDGTPFGGIPGQVNCGYYLDELTMENGPIVIVPGSHRALFKPPVGHPSFPDEKFVLAKPGQAVMFHGWLYHRGAANRSEQPRRVCLMCYQNAWMKSREGFDGPRIRSLRERGTPEQKLLLGEVEHW
jgi:hypothetical protein